MRLKSHFSESLTIGEMRISSQPETDIEKTRSFIDLHVAFIRTADFNRVWIVDVPKSSIEPKVIAGEADGNFVVLNHGKT